MDNLKNLSILAGIASEAALAGSEVLKIPIEDVQSKKQIRTRFRYIEGLAKTFKVEGQQSPIIVSPRNSDGKYIIQKGERRWRAAKLAEFETIDAIVKEKPVNRAEEAAGEMIENIQRDDLSPMELSDALQICADEGWTQQQIADRIGKSPSFVSLHLSLQRLPDEAVILCEDDIIGDPETLHILRQIHEIDSDLCLRLCKQAEEENGISRSVCRKILKGLIKPEGESDEELEADLDTPRAEHAGVASFEQDNKAADDYDTPDTPDTPANNVVSFEGHNKASQNTEPPSEENHHPASTSSASDDEYKEEQTDWVDEAEKESAKAKTVTGGKDWAAIEPSELEINMTVMVRDVERPCVLLLDRVSLDPSLLWVFLTDEKIGHLASVDDVVLESVKKNPMRV